MSLVGSLDDLGLGEILQIVSLSGKSGVLQLRAEQGEGRIVFHNGLIRGAFAKGGPTELAELLAREGTLDAAALAPLAESARGGGAPLAGELVRQGLLSEEQLDQLRRAHVEASVFAMFRWRRGEFSFEVCEDSMHPDSDLFVLPGVNPQFLALEGTRLFDEQGREGFDDEAPDPSDDAEPMLALDDDEAPGLALTEPGFAAPEVAPAELAASPLEIAPADEVAVEPEIAPAELVEEDAEDPALGDAGAAAPSAEPVPPAPQPAAPVAAGSAAATRAAPGPAKRAALPPLVAIDGDLAVLEWVKSALGEAFPRVHIFQRTDQGISRLRQYLARGEVPVLLLARNAPPDPLSGSQTAAEIVARLRAQAPRMPIVLLDAVGVAAEPLGSGCLEKPTPTHLADPRCAPERQVLARTLRSGLADLLGIEIAAPKEPLPPDVVARLKQASARLRDPASQGEVLSLVMEFARAVLGRVGLFMLRDGVAIGVGGSGLESAGGPDDAGLRDLQIPAREVGWFRRVIDGRAPVRAAPGDDGDRGLAARLGEVLPAQAYVAPIESADQIVALLYGDNLPAGTEIGDTAALEVLLHEAGLALDRAVLERALEEAEGL